MSGQATGWVLRCGPRPDDIDRMGTKYGQRARGWRAVLLTIADAANRDGEHAYPGHQAMVEGSLYGRSQVVSIVRELIAEGWLSIEQEGGGRGKATVYRVEMERRETGHSPAGFDGRKPRDPGGETARSGPVNRATAPVPTSGFADANVVPTKDPTRDARETPPSLLGDSFETFWLRYPKCANKGAKERARREWQKHARDVEAVTAGLEGWVAYWEARGEPEFICAAGKWLAEERWVDGPPPLRLDQRRSGTVSYEDQPVRYL